MPPTAVRVTIRIQGCELSIYLPTLEKSYFYTLVLLNLPRMRTRGENKSRLKSVQFGTIELKGRRFQIPFVCEGFSSFALESCKTEAKFLLEKKMCGNQT